MIVCGLRFSRWQLGIGLMGLAFALASPAIAEAPPPSTELRQSAQLIGMTPSGKYLRRGTSTITVNFNVNAVPAETVEFIGVLTLNGKPYGPITFVVTPGETFVQTDMRWVVHPTGDRASIRFRLLGISNTTKIGVQFYDVTKDYILFTPNPRKAKPPKCTCSFKGSSGTKPKASQ
jgi:hypothetical protein